MGQGISRPRSPTRMNADEQAVEGIPQSSIAVDSPASVDGTQGSTSAEVGSTTMKPSKRTAKRRLTDFVTSGFKAGTSAHGEGESTVTKKRWRASRRWSAFPTSSPPATIATAVPAEAVLEPIIQGSAGVESVEGIDTDTLPQGQPIMDILERQDDLAVEENAEASLAAPPADISVPIPDSPRLRPVELPNTPTIQATDIPMGPETLPESQASEAPTQPEISPSPPIVAPAVTGSPSVPAPRPFPTPTPGTLVVVQGVVQTAPPPPIAGRSTAPISEPSRPRSLSHGANRNRLSELFRPLNPSAPTPTSTEPPPYADPSSSSSAALRETSSSSSLAEGERPENGGLPEPSATSSISPNSIDVLGALLG